MIEHTYFGWNRLTHTTTCTSPTWDIDVRHDPGTRPLVLPDVAHQCPDNHCAHKGEFDRVTVRVICRSCDTAHVITGEALTRVTTTTDALGYGQPPRQMAGLYLWPSRPVLHGHGPGPSGQDDQPFEYLVTTTLVDRLTPDDCVGVISRHRTAGGHSRWWAGAVSTPPPLRVLPEPGEYRLAWAHRSSDHTTVDQAAAWIAATIDPAQQTPLVVAV
ncbi:MULTISPECIES: hypothetical protein [Streptomyces]|uniref:Uncharacterized protein n=1 Tax=Streptomyces europaeiscabiei TaxID=146819 RepID=A0ABU4NRE0_9ACTN|nr:MULTISPECIES: hypothetical protein [Streptomyces]MBP5922134.1 hypothetical protein [Streptomyces sp. LBUM 1483]MDX3555233.1 hypothetical protein [Streptomyces europaeiscabiei]MDX3705247.1 hypothetical protein [Streptomyces europaeiscabiei]MDX3864341.1 hypothetical protein [Streptomyces europaeiscabiei]MDX3871577.1 hypothetical protein [Streptomyces europaeiscabiei]